MSGLLKAMTIHCRWNMYHIDLQMKQRHLFQHSEPQFRTVFHHLDLSAVKDYFKMAFVSIVSAYCHTWQYKTLTVPTVSKIFVPASEILGIALAYQNL